MNMMGMGGPGGQPGQMTDTSKMQDMMNNPSMSKLLDNPEFLSNTLNMLKNPAMRP